VTAMLRVGVSGAAVCIRGGPERVATVRVQKDSFDAGFWAKFNIFKLTIPDTVCMKILQIFPPVRE